ncbi:MAG: hypothetical protein QM504_03805 [Pseudomonadota bacterium]
MDKGNRTMNKINISYFGHKRDNHIEQTEILYWSDFRDTVLSEHTIVEDKDFILFNGMSFLDRENAGFVRRAADNVSWITLLILDYDGEETIETIKKRFSKYEYAGYTSYSHKTQSKNCKDCFRIVMPIHHPITMEHYKSRKKAVLEWAGDVDRSSTDISRGFYLPSCSQETIDNAETWFNCGELVNVTDFDEEKLIEHNYDDVKPLEDDKKQLIKEKLSQMFLGYEPDWIKVMWAMKNNGYAVNDFIDVTVYGNLMNSKTVEDCKKRWSTAKSKNTNVGYLINLIRRKGDPEFFKPKAIKDNTLEQLIKTKRSET